MKDNGFYQNRFSESQKVRVGRARGAVIEDRGTQHQTHQRDTQMMFKSEDCLDQKFKQIPILNFPKHRKY